MNTDSRRCKRITQTYLCLSACISGSVPNRKEWFTAFNGPLGFGIGSFDSDEAKPIFKELAELKKAKRVTIGNQSYALRFRQFESFGKTVHRIQIKK